MTPVNRILIIGLGEIGYSTAEYFSAKGLEVDGYDISKKAIDRAVKGGVIKNRPHSFDEFDCFVICVSTHNQADMLEPDLSAIDEVTDRIAKEVKGSALVVIESTVSRGVTQKIFDKLNPEIDHRFCVVHIPHRYYGPEKDIHGVNQRRVLGACCPCGANKATELYHSRLAIPLHPVKSIDIAEMTKIVENSYRFLQIAFAEELKMYCESSGIDFEELRAACNTKWNVQVMEARYGIGGHCLMPTELIQTETGLIQIQNISIGDKVLTHDGKYHKVIDIMKREYTGELIELTPRGFPRNPICATPEHPILGMLRTNENRFYNNHGNPKMKTLKTKYLSLLDFRDISNYKQGDILVLPRIAEPETAIIPEIPVAGGYHRRGQVSLIKTTPEIMFLLGCYLANGSTYKNEVQFGFHSNMRNYIILKLNNVTTLFGSKIGVNVDESESGEGNRLVLRTKCEPLREYVDQIKLGHSASTKSVPDNWIHLPKEHLRALLNGLWFCDGSSSGKRFVYATVSMRLFNFIQLAMLRLQIPFGVNIQNERTGKDGIRRQKTYYIQTSDIVSMNKLVPEKAIQVTRRKARTIWFDDNFMYFAIRKVRKIHYSGFVYNIEVEHSHSYVLQSGTVHNCLPKDTKMLIDMYVKKNPVKSLLETARQVDSAYKETRILKLN